MEEPYIQLFTKLYDRQRATVHTDVDSKQFRAKPCRATHPARFFLRRLSATHRENLLLRSGTETTTELDVSNTTATRTSPTAGSLTTYFYSAALTTATTAHDPQLHPIQQKPSPKRHQNPENNTVAVQEMNIEVLPPEGKIENLNQLITVAIADHVQLDRRINCAWALFARHREELTSPRYPLSDRPCWSERVSEWWSQSRSRVSWAERL